MLMLILKFLKFISLSYTTTFHTSNKMLNIQKINQSNKLFDSIKKSYRRSLYLVLILKSTNFISISNICQNFHTLRFNIEENQNLEPIYYRSQISKFRTQNSKLKT